MTAMITAGALTTRATASRNHDIAPKSGADDGFATMLAALWFAPIMPTSPMAESQAQSSAKDGEVPATATVALNPGVSLASVASVAMPPDVPTDLVQADDSPTDESESQMANTPDLNRSVSAATTITVDGQT